MRKYKKLEKELLIDNGNLNNDYELYLSERKKMLPFNERERKEMEIVIKQMILTILKKAKKDAISDDESLGYFNYQPFLEIPYLKKYFNIFVINADRNIGKTWSSRIVARDTVNNGGRFMWWRNIDDEIEAQLKSDLETFIYPNGWTFTGPKKMPDIVNLDNEVVGYYRPINTSAKLKSIEFPKVETIVYEEFNEVKISDKFLKVVKLISTIQRHNPNLKVLMQANYISQNDEMLQAMGMSNKQFNIKNHYVVFDWIVGSIIINVPRGIYREFKDKSKDLGYRTALATYDTWKSQFGGGFGDEEAVNIIDGREFSSILPLFNIYLSRSGLPTQNQKYGAFKMTVYDVYDNEGIRHNVIRETVGSNNAPVFVFDHISLVQYPNAHIMDIEGLENVLNHWNNGNLKTTDLTTHSKITMLLSLASKLLGKDSEYINEIENILK